MYLFYSLYLGGVLSLSPTEQEVVGLLAEWKVAPLDRFLQKLKVSRITVLRAFTKYGYYSSYNLNSSFYTLRDIPRFDRDGLWKYEEVRFSRHGGVRETVRALVSGSPGGLSVEELEERLGVRVHNALSALCRAGELGRFRAGRRAVYLSSQREAAREQEAMRRRAFSPRKKALSEMDLPPGLDALTVIGVLIGRIESAREAGLEAVASRVEAEGIAVSPRDVERVMKFYGLKKTTR
jgi:hypothetical protein